MLPLMKKKIKKKRTFIYLHLDLNFKMNKYR